MLILIKTILKGLIFVNSFEKIYDIVRKIPRGKVATYGLVALFAGNPRWARVVGYALHSNPNPTEIPCHRVVNRFGKTSGSYAFGGESRQRELLEGEGVVFLENGNVDMEKCLWNGEKA